MKLHTSFSHRVLGLIISILMFASFVFAVGEIDATFLPKLQKPVTGGIPNLLAIQPDDKTLLLTNPSVIQPTVYRLNTDGTLDSTFNCQVCNFLIRSAIVQPDGKILIAGSLNLNTPKIIRLNSDGSLDSTFNFSYNCGTPVCEARVLVTQAGGKFYGTITSNPPPVNINIQVLRRFNPDGTFDASFTPFSLDGGALTKLVILPDGKLMVSSGSPLLGYIFRLNPDGTKDLSFQSPTFTSNSGQPYIQGFIMKNDGKIIVYGSFHTVNGINRQAIVRLTDTGSFDPQFSYQPADGFEVFSAAQVFSNGKFIAFLSSPFFSKLVRFNADDTIDTTYTPLTTGLTINFFIDSLDRIVTPTNRINYNGSLDTGYVPADYLINAKVSGSTLVRQPDGKLIVAGDFTKSNSISAMKLTRLNPDGTTDLTFNVGTGFDIAPNLLAIQSDGKILAGGRFTVFNGFARTKLIRLNIDGSLDTTFVTAVDDYVNAIQPLPTGKLLIGGFFTRVNAVTRQYLARLNADGTLDSTFNVSISGFTISAIRLLTNGKTLVSGVFTSIGGLQRSAIARLNADGSVDSSFTSLSGANCFSIIEQPDGKYLFAKKSNNISFNTPTVFRLNPDGSFDGGFLNTVFGGSLPAVNAIHLQSDGSIIIAGSFNAINGTPRRNIARLNPVDGSLNTTFLTEGADDIVNAMVGQPDGKFIVGGDFSNIGGVARTGLARLNGTALVSVRPLFDFDGDGKADVAVFRPSTGVWYRLLSGNSSVSQNNFGIANDIPVPADYDGDGKTDLAIFRPSTGTFWYLSSINNAQIANQWGQNGDIPRPSDFDGDGKADLVVFRPSENNWYRFGSTGLVSTKNFGSIGDKPVIGDFDGDGKSDPAIFRPSTGDWWYQSSVDNSQRATHFGASTDIPAAADYDGDGKTDFAVYRPSTGVWYILNSSTGSATILNFGLAEDKPVPADYDGDGKSDIAVFRPSTGTWYLLRSTSGFTGLNFGISSDVPVPNSFIP